MFLCIYIYIMLLCYHLSLIIILKKVRDGEGGRERERERECERERLGEKYGISSDQRSRDKLVPRPRGLLVASSTWQHLEDTSGWFSTLRSALPLATGLPKQAFSDLLFCSGLFI